MRESVDSREMRLQVVEHDLSKDLTMSHEMSVSTQGKSSGTKKEMIRRPSQQRLWLRFNMLNEPVESGEDVGGGPDKESLKSP